MEPNADIRLLFKKYLAGECTLEEVETLYAHFGLDSNDPNLHTILMQYFNDTKEHSAAALSRAKRVSGQAWPHVEATIGGRTSALKKPQRLVRYFVAALILVGITVGIGLYLRNQSTGIAPALTSKYGGDALPGGNHATLTLADGRTIDLSQEQAGIVVGDGITYLDGSTVLAEQANAGANEKGPDSPHGGLTAYDLQLTTPNGGTYAVTLPDGTKVWLNAASTLKYPSRFNDDERVVELTGEAYFDVSEQVSQGTSDQGHGGPSRGTARSQAHKFTSSQKLPFKVISNGQTVEVLGTEFNISAYPGEEATKTTLVEGKVKVSSSSTQAGLTTHDSRLTTKVLTPGDQATIRGAAIETQKVNVQSYVGWRNGLFIFHELSLREVLDQLERWYDITVTDIDLPNVAVYGEISRGTKLSEVLALIEAATDVRFELTERRLSIVN